MKNILAFIALTALLVTAYPHELSKEHFEKREQSATQFADSVRDCDTRVKFRHYGEESNPIPNFDAVKRFKIGPKFHAQTAIRAQLSVKYTFSNSFFRAIAPSLISMTDHDIIAYKGPQNSACARVVLAQDSDVSSFAVNGSRQEGKDFFAAGIIPAEDWFQDLYDTIIWDPAPQNGSIQLWPYQDEVEQFRNCLTPWCTKREETYRLYNEAFGGSLLMEDPTDADHRLGYKWRDEDMVKVLDSCKDTPVFFTNISKAEEEYPAWIVSRKDGPDHWVLDTVESFDQEHRSESMTVREIFEQVLPEYPEVVFAKSQ